MEFRYDAYCGLYCGACGVLIANERDKLEQLAKAWEVEPEKLECHGCKSETSSSFCVSCNIRSCAESKEIDFCFQCEQFPCTRLVEFKNDKYTHHSIILRNLAFIRDKGVGEWLEEQRIRWSCPSCGERFSWYDEICKKCGRKLHNCVNDLKTVQHFEKTEGEPQSTTPPFADA